MSSALSWYVIIGTGLSLLACLWLIFWTNRQRQSDADIAESESHVWDENIRELNNPLPMWWLYSFIITVIFSFAYLVVYPGFGNFAGTFGWSQIDQYEQEVAAAEAQYGPIFARYGEMDIAALALDQQALDIGQSLFANYCAQCHGSTARGATGFPNLVDDDWLYGGEPDKIEHAILIGRSGIMPALATAMGDDLDGMITYVQEMPDGLNAGSPIHTKYVTFCSACHGVDGTGNQLLGGPNLTDDIWLYGSSDASIRRTLVEGRNGVMPAHRNLIGEDRARILAAYVYSLSRGTGD
jgi:cytochrome c oxidase cbb3-type subunit 3